MKFICASPALVWAASAISAKSRAGGIEPAISVRLSPVFVELPVGQSVQRASFEIFSAARMWGAAAETINPPHGK